MITMLLKEVLCKVHVRSQCPWLSNQLTGAWIKTTFFISKKLNKTKTWCWLFWEKLNSVNVHLHFCLKSVGTLPLCSSQSLFSSPSKRCMVPCPACTASVNRISCRAVVRFHPFQLIQVLFSELRLYNTVLSFDRLQFGKCAQYSQLESSMYSHSTQLSCLRPLWQMSGLHYRVEHCVKYFVLFLPQRPALHI